MSIAVMSTVFGREIKPISRKMVALKLGDVANEDGSNIWPSVDTVAAEAGLSRTTAKLQIKGLRDLGVLRLVEKGGRGPRSTNKYAFDMDALRALPTAKPADDDAENKGSDSDPLAKREQNVSKWSDDVSKGSESDPKPSYRTNTPLPPTGGSEFCEFEEFEEIWPWQGQERRDLARSAFDEQPETDRREILKEVPRYLADVKAGRGRSKRRLQADKFIKSGIWKNRHDPSLPDHYCFVLRDSQHIQTMVIRQNRKLNRTYQHTGMIVDHKNPKTGLQCQGHIYPQSWLDEAGAVEDVDYFKVTIER